MTITATAPTWTNTTTVEPAKAVQYALAFLDVEDVEDLDDSDPNEWRQTSLRRADLELFVRYTDGTRHDVLRHRFEDVEPTRDAERAVVELANAMIAGAGYNHEGLHLNGGPDAYLTWCSLA